MCGIKKPVKAGTSTFTWVVAGVIGLSVISTIIHRGDAPPSPTASAATSSAAPQPVPSKPKADPDFEVKKAATVASIELRSAMRNPASFEMVSVLQMPDKTVCYAYRAQNGYGGLNLEHAVLTSKGQLLAGDTDARRTAWNRNCASKVGRISKAI
jgi:hypothetical protein